MKSPSFSPKPGASNRTAQFTLQAMAIDSRFSEGSVSQESTNSPRSLSKNQFNEGEDKLEIESPMRLVRAGPPPAGAFAGALAAAGPKQVLEQDGDRDEGADDEELQFESESSNAQENNDEARALPSLQGSLAACAIPSAGDNHDSGAP